MADFIHIWKFPRRPTKCPKCGQLAVTWVTAINAQMFPFDVTAKPVRSYIHARLEIPFDVYDGSTAFHSQHCTGKKPRKRRTLVDKPRLVPQNHDA